MSLRFNKVSKDLLNTIKESPKKGTTPYDSVAEVVRIDGDTAWVHIAGGVDETPVSRTIDCKEGDMVQIRVGGGTAWITGNSTAPPTDDTKANVAYNYAETASNDAFRARQSAINAENEAERAYVAANSAQASANLAQASADSAQTSANNALASAVSANNSANNALTQLSTVEDVVDVLNWISEHGTYKVSTDTEVVAGKFYFTRTGSGTTADPYVYTVVANPTGNPSTSGYYELDSVDEAISNYVSTHLALTDEGLFLVKDGSGYKLKLTDYGEYIVAPNGTVVNQMTADGNIIRSSNGTVIAHLGYGEGTSESGNADAPFYTLGTRYPSTAPQYDSTSTYEVGDCCTYSGKLWRCVSAISTPEAFNTGHWWNLIGNASMAEGKDVEASGYLSHAEGRLTRATDSYSHAEGHSTEARGQGSHAEGYHDNNQADVVRSILASGTGSHAEGMAHGGYAILASGQGSHAEGLALSGNNIARGDGSHTEGSGNTASGNYAHAEGGYNTASGIASHVEGMNSEASGHSSHAQNYGTIAGEDYQTAIGKFNANYQNGAFIIGNGAIGLRSNALTVDWDGIVQASGAIAYGVCDTAGATASKVVTVSHNGFKLVTGSQVLIKFTNANTVASPTLNVNGTGAKAIRRYGTTAPSTSAASSWNAGSVILLIYDGTDWQMVGFLNTTYSSMTDAEYQAGTSTTARLITPARLKSAILYHATPSNIGLGNVENKSSATIRSEITSSNVTSALGFNPVSKTAICYANSRVDNFSSGQVNIANTSLGVTTGSKPVGILLTPSSSTVVMRYHYDGSDGTNSNIRAYNLDGTGFSGNLRYFCVVFQNSWTST